MFSIIEWALLTVNVVVDAVPSNDVIMGGARTTIATNRWWCDLC